MRMRSKKLSVLRIKLRIQRLLDPGQVDFGVFNAWMVAVNRDSQKGNKQKQREFCAAGIFFQVLNL